MLAPVNLVKTVPNGRIAAAKAFLGIEVAVTTRPAGDGQHTSIRGVLIAVAETDSNPRVGPIAVVVPNCSDPAHALAHAEARWAALSTITEIREP